MCCCKVLSEEWGLDCMLTTVLVFKFNHVGQSEEEDLFLEIDNQCNCGDYYV